MKNKTVYLLLVIIALVIYSPVYAAKSVPGNVPELAPLQPAPENVKPNISGNIESTIEIDPEIQKEKDAAAAEDTQALGSEDFPSQAVNSFFPAGFTSSWIFLLIALLAVLVGSLVGYYKHNRNKK